MANIIWEEKDSQVEITHPEVAFVKWPVFPSLFYEADVLFCFLMSLKANAIGSLR